MKTTIKLLTFILLACLSLFPSNEVMAQNFSNEHYLKGAVTEENGFVVFRQTYNCPGKSQDDIYSALEAYTKQLLKAKNALVQCRITQATQEDATLAASMEETITFKSTNWILDTARMFYQVVFQAHDNGFDAMIRRIHYIYEPMEVHGIETSLAAEDWITDQKALNKKGQLTKVGGKKFRYQTIKRKDEIFQQAYNAVMQK